MNKVFLIFGVNESEGKTISAYTSATTAAIALSNFQRAELGCEYIIESISYLEDITKIIPSNDTEKLSEIYLLETNHNKYLFSVTDESRKLEVLLKNPHAEQLSLYSSNSIII